MNYFRNFFLIFIYLFDTFHCSEKLNELLKEYNYDYEYNKDLIDSKSSISDNIDYVMSLILNDKLKKDFFYVPSVYSDIEYKDELINKWELDNQKRELLKLAQQLKKKFSLNLDDLKTIRKNLELLFNKQDTNDPISTTEKISLKNLFSSFDTTAKVEANFQENELGKTTTSAPETTTLKEEKDKELEKKNLIK